jgi:hypothetical protein
VPNQKKGSYLQHKNWLCSVNRYAKATRHSQKLDILITLNAVPGTLIALDIPLFYVGIETKLIDEYYELRTAFTLGTCVILKKILDLD